MTPDEIVEVGNYCEMVLDHPIFRHLCNNFQRIQTEAILQSAVDKTAQREEAYHTFRGATEFLTYMNDFVVQKDAFMKESADREALFKEAGFNTDMPTDDEVLLGDL